MRSLLVAMIACIGSAAQASSPELVTRGGAVLCVQAANVAMANEPKVRRLPISLKGMGGIRSPAGIRIKPLEPVANDGPMMVRFYPEEISKGVVLWGMPSAFTDAERTRSTTPQG